LYAALEIRTGKVIGKTAPRHTSAEFVEFLNEVIISAKWAREIHIVLDNLSAHKTKAVQQLLEANPKVRLHFTPTYSSWLNQVEIWFSKIERDVIARGVFTSVADLARKLRKYIRAYSKSAKPLLSIRWEGPRSADLLIQKIYRSRTQSGPTIATTTVTSPALLPHWRLKATHFFSRATLPAHTEMSLQTL
jgi:transposase